MIENLKDFLVLAWIGPGEGQISKKTMGDLAAGGFNASLSALTPEKMVNQLDLAHEAGVRLIIRVPEQLRIVTHANKGSAGRYPLPVTEIQMDPERYAEALGGMLLKRLRGEAVEPPTVILPFELLETVPAAAPVAARIVPHEVAVEREG
jgi:hypothetical protein